MAQSTQLALPVPERSFLTDVLKAQAPKKPNDEKDLLKRFA